MVKDHSDSKRGNPLLSHGLLFPIAARVLLMHYPTDKVAHTTAFDTPVVEHWLEREIDQWVQRKNRNGLSHYEMGDIPYISTNNKIT